ncbi:General secretion pathway D protein, outer membrane secretin [gamma proteobacterium HdN1]|nr:General secretion pathway D protein, outer membrane secretin [gamma proteobacterium HdN1]
MFNSWIRDVAPAWVRGSCLAVMLTFTAGVLASSAIAEEPEPTWRINMKQADIRQLIELVSEATGNSFIVDPRVKGNITVISDTEMSKKEIMEMFESVLKVHNFATVRTGKMLKIIPTQMAKQDNVPIEKPDRDSDLFITQVIPVRFASATELVPILRPLIPQYGHLAAVTSANALIISDHSDNVQRMIDIVRRLDTSESEESEVIQLKNAWVGDVVKMLEQLGSGGSKAGGGSAGGSGRVKAVADERTNRLILRGDRDARRKLHALVLDLDRPGEHSISTRVIYLRYADAVKISEVLRGIVTGQATTPTSTTAGGMQTASRTPGSSFGNSSAGLGGNSSMGMSGAGVSSSTSRQRGTSTPIQAGNITIQADDTLNALVVRASPSDMGEIRSLIKQLDVRRAQVLIEAAIVEVTGSAGNSLGVQWGAANENRVVGGTNFSNVGNSISALLGAALSSSGSDSTGTTSSTTTTMPTLSNGITLGGGHRNSAGKVDFGLILQAVNTASNTNVLSTPSIMTLDNEEAEILVGQNVPFITGNQLSYSGTNPFQTVERKDVGLNLKVIPQVNAGDTISLRVTQEASSIADSSNVKTTDVITNKRLINTTILASDGQVIVLGGLMEDTLSDAVQKVPLLGDIPLIGALFRSTSKVQEKRNLLLFLRPTVIRDDAKAESVMDRKYGQIRGAALDRDSIGEIELDVNELLNKTAHETLDRGSDAFSAGGRP